jgi:hypothetical protein
LGSWVCGYAAHDPAVDKASLLLTGETLRRWLDRWRNATHSSKLGWQDRIEDLRRAGAQFRKLCGQIGASTVCNIARHEIELSAIWSERDSND